MIARIATVVLAIFAIAQQSTDVTPNKGAVTLPEGTEVSLKLAQDVNSRAAKPNEPIELSLAEDLKVGDIVVAKAGARIGLIKHGKNVEVKEGTLLGARYVVIRGSQAILKTGTPVKAYVAEDTTVTAN